jgi:hypothetical protein
VLNHYIDPGRNTGFGQASIRTDLSHFKIVTPPAAENARAVWRLKANGRKTSLRS